MNRFNRYLSSALIIISTSASVFAEKNAHVIGLPADITDESGIVEVDSASEITEPAVSFTTNSVNFLKNQVVIGSKSLGDDLHLPVISGKNVTPLGAQASSFTHNESPETQIEHISAVRSTTSELPIEWFVPEGTLISNPSEDGSIYLTADTSKTFYILVPPKLLNVINIPFERPITTTTFPKDIVKNELRGAVQIGLSGNQPAHVLIRESGRPDLSVSLFLIPAEVSPASIYIDIPEARLNAKSQSLLGVKIVEAGDPLRASEVELGKSHSLLVADNHISLSQGFVPEGYSLTDLNDGLVGVLCGDRRLIGEHTQTLMGPKFIVDVYRVTNVSEGYLSFEEKNCYRTGVASVQFHPTRHLLSGQQVELFIQRHVIHKLETNKLPRHSTVEGTIQ